MKHFLKLSSCLSAMRSQNKRPPAPAGNVLLYVVVLMLIFGMLGVVMVSLFTSSMASTVTRNDTRRAIYMAESGMRYAFSELRKADFEEDVIINTLNTTTYTVTDAGSFTINVFSPWFDADGNTNNPGGGPLPLVVPIGTIPQGYTIPASNTYAINYEFTDLTPTPGGWAPVSGIASQTDTTITLNLTENFYANPDERVSLAVHPKSDQQILDGGNLIVFWEAQTIFPKYGGAINIRRNDYFYEERIDDPDNNRVILRNLSKRPESVFGITATTSDFVVLSPRNYLVVPTGKSDGTIYGGNYLFGKGIYDASLIRPGSAPPDITAEDLTENLSEQETGGGFFDVDAVEDTLTIGGGSGQFGSAFFDADMSIGGDQDYCQRGACKFALGVRAFFLVNFSSQGEGITFTLTNGATNSETSVGGDIDLSELMAYGGDSRTNSSGTNFVATDSNDRGLDPPKIAVEFDTRTNNSLTDPPPDYCADASTVNTDTRNDPLTGNKDAIQYIFWGRTSFLNILCRANNPLYDDNRHDADGEEPTEEWRFATGVPSSFWRPAIGPDGTIYMSALDSTLYALNPDGSVKWSFPLGDNNDYMPGVDPNTGTIYSDRSGNKLVAINPDGTPKWEFIMNSDVDSTPVVGPDGTIYFGTDDDAFALFAVNPDGTEKWRFVTGDEIDNVPALSPDATVVYVVSNDDNLYAVNAATGAGIWNFPIAAESGEVNSSPTVNPADGTIYVGSDDHKVYALNPAARTAGLPFPQAGEWAFTTGADVESSAAIDDGGTPGDKSDDTIYIGSDDTYLYAIRANGTQRWRYQTNDEIVSSPVIDLDGTVYVGSDDGRVYAINPNGTQKWFFPTGAVVRSSPALGPAGFIHIGSDDGRFYTISQFADPRNFKDEDKSAGKLLTVEDLSSSTEVVEVNSIDDWLNGKPGVKGPYAVRLEVNRSLAANPDGEFDYELRLWIRQCKDDVLCNNILGTFFQDTRIEYDYSAVPATLPMVQRFRLSAIDQAKFDRFYFGFTGAAGAEALNVVISQFQLSFIRPGDPLVTDDSTSWPP